VRKAMMITGACMLTLGACAVPPAPQAQANISPTAVRTAWLSKGRYVWQPLVSDTQYTSVRPVTLARKDTTPRVASVQRVLACDLTGFSTGCATY
jgi:hypothetical protein